MKTVFLRVLEADDKAGALRAAIHDPPEKHGRQRFEVDPATFVSVPRSPFAYWVGERLRRLFVELPPLESDGREARVGDHPGDSLRYLRLQWEIPVPSNRHWQQYQKGGQQSAYYVDLHLTAD